MKTINRIEQIAGISALVLLVVGCFVVLRPFLSALMWAAILCYCTWPLYLRLEHLLKNRRTPAALVMVLLISSVLVLPFAVVGFNLAESLSATVAMIQQILKDGLPKPPPWLTSLPLVGDSISTYWQGLANNPEKTTVMIKDYFLQGTGWLLQRGVDLGQGILQLSLSVLISFFLYRDGEEVIHRVSDAVAKIAGDRTQYLLGVVGNTIKSVVYGLLGTALAQGILAGVGLRIAGVPNSLLLGLFTFFLALLPFGPPLVWVPSAIWLYYEKHVGLAIFMLVWGTLCISGIDNFLRPWLICRGTNLPFVLVLLGVIGGVFAFGFIGVFIGPVLLAVSYALMQEWAGEQKPDSRGVVAPDDDQDVGTPPG